MTIIVISLILLVIILVSINSVINKHDIEEKGINLAKMNAAEEIILIQTKLSDYKAACIDGKLITNQTATPLDNIAYFVTIIYPTLSDNQKSKCTAHLFVYSENIVELLNQISKTPVANDPKETDAWYTAQAERMSNLYTQLMMSAYEQAIKEHIDEFSKLSTYNYMEMQKQVEIWKLANSYAVNETIDTGGL